MTQDILFTFDFDGVVSPINKQYDYSVDADYEVYRLGGFKCALHKEVLEFVNWAHTHPEIQTVWATSWVDMTEHFPKDSNGALPEMPYLDLRNTQKGDAILKYAVQQGVKFVHVFEDDTRVRGRIKRLMDKNPEAYPFQLSFHKSQLKVGITAGIINATKAAVLRQVA